MMKKYDQLTQKFSNEKFKLNEPLSKHTTLKIGGPADRFYTAKDTRTLVDVVATARELEIPITMLGDGSNVLVSDEGVRGLVIRNSTNNITIHKTESNTDQQKSKSIPVPRWESDKTSGTFKYEFKDLDYDESGKPTANVTIDSGVQLPAVLHYLLDNKITGLQWFSGIPGTIGGAIFNNIHGGTRFFCEFLDSVTVLTPQNETKTYSDKDCLKDYNSSIFHDSGDIILTAVLQLHKGNVERAKYTTHEWANRKSIQPRNSPGCAFSNITQEQKEKLSYPTTAMGYIIEHILKMSGFRVGDAAISGNHHNFIVNEGNATAKDYLAVMKEIHDRSVKKIGFCPKPEIFFLGFEENEIHDPTS